MIQMIDTGTRNQTVCVFAVCVCVHAQPHKHSHYELLGFEYSEG
jgi:hypothetical protein